MSKLDAFQCYKLYISIKTHFNNPKYDYFEKRGKVRATRQAFEKRNDKAFFYRIAKQYQKKEVLEKFFVANFIENNAMWIGDAVESEATDVYTAWRGRTDSIGYLFKNDMEVLLSKIPGKTVAHIFFVEDGQHPILFKSLLEGEISFETFTIMLNMVSDKFKKEALDDEIDDEIIWPEYRLKSKKYLPFLGLEKDRYKEIITELTCLRA